MIEHDDISRRFFWLAKRMIFGLIFLSVPGLCLGGDAFTINADGSVLAGALQFTGMGDYAASDYFREQGRRCGTRKPSAAMDMLAARSVDDCTLSLTRIQEEYRLSGIELTIPVWFHVLYNSQGTGNISDEAVNAQMRVLNEDFRALAGSLGGEGFDTKIQFELAGVTRTQNDSWFNDNNDGYVQALNRDPARSVNIYTNSAGGFLGYTFLPQDSPGNDYIVIAYQAIGGRDNGFDSYDQGRTLVHEMGHYLGLLHTFDAIAAVCGNGYTQGDLIADTPAESFEHYECSQTYTCNSPDPIHNYMNYTPDNCMNEFTSEQGNRMVCSLLNYRPNLSGATVNGEPVASAVVIPLLNILLGGK